MHDHTGNLPPMPAIFPDMMAPVVRKADDGERELVMLRWGLPTPRSVLQGIDRGVTNVRNLGSPHWRAWTGVSQSVRRAGDKLLRAVNACRSGNR
ncbi:MAG: hypothetical protein WDN02_05135 [Methylovirgula sp.]|uniref:hypothetical protein n=1 Tax=Methylovirgula sp. TaxID=1978224 RepID=UPI003076586D